jgi:hypothetical protein
MYTNRGIKNNRKDYKSVPWGIKKLQFRKISEFLFILCLIIDQRQSSKLYEYLLKR